MNHQISTPKRPPSPQSVVDIPDLMDEKQVRFTAHVEIAIFDRIDPALKADLYYSREEMYCIRQEVKTTIILHAQRIKLKQIQAQFNERKVQIDSLIQHYQSERNNNGKRLHDNHQSIGESPVLEVKRRRVQE